jgi:hypothetical protein
MTPKSRDAALSFEAAALVRRRMRIMSPGAIWTRSLARHCAPTCDITSQKMWYNLITEEATYLVRRKLSPWQCNLNRCGPLQTSAQSVLGLSSVATRQATTLRRRCGQVKRRCGRRGGRRLGERRTRHRNISHTGG